MFRWITLLGVALVLAACGTPTDNLPFDDTGAAPVDQASPVVEEAMPSPADETADASDTAARDGMYDAPPEMTIDPSRSYTATIETTEGTMQVELFPEEAPLAVNNFVFLAREGFYDGVRFHRIIKDFMVQTGDPLGNGTGGPGYSFEVETLSSDQSYTLGTVAMANRGTPDSNGSQFFIINTESYPLPPQYTIFGRVTEGLDVLQRISNTPVTMSPGGVDNVPSMPTEDVLIERITIQEQ